MNKLDALFKKPERSERPLRILLVGGPKTGKSHFVFTATDVGPVYWQDTEHGADLYPDDHGHGFQVLLSKDPGKTIEAIEAANAQVTDGNPRPIIATDSMSSVWSQQQEVHDQLVRTFGKFGAWAPAKKPLKQLYELMHATRCHVVITSRSKTEWEVDAKGKPEEKGIVPDVERNLAYAVDLILLLGKDMPEEDRPLTPQDFWARVIGTRSPSVDGQPPPIPVGMVFRDPKFSDLLAAVVEGSPPTQVEDTTGRQVERAAKAPRSFKRLVNDRDVEKQGWAGEQIKAALREKFGEYDAERLPEYWEYLKTHSAAEYAAGQKGGQL